MLSWLIKKIDNSCLSCRYYEHVQVESARMEETDGSKHIIPARYVHMCRYQTYDEARRQREQGKSERETKRIFTDRAYDVPLTSLTPCKAYEF